MAWKGDALSRDPARPMRSARPVRIAHVSDPHLPLPAPRGWGRPDKRDLSRLSRRLGWRRRHDGEIADRAADEIAAAAPDLVAVGGDVAHLSLPAEFEAARAWLRRLGPEGRVALVPGNHEALVAGMEGAMRRAWAPWIAGDDGAPGFPWLRRLGPVGVIGLSSAVATPPGRAGGRVGAAQIAALSDLLARLRAEGRLAAVVVHHPPTPVVRPRKALADAPALRAALAEGGAGLVLHGHAHRAALSWIDGAAGRIPVLGVGSASAPRGAPIQPAAWRLLEIDADAAGWRLRLRERALGEDGAFRDATPLIFRLPGPAPDLSPGAAPAGEAAPAACAGPAAARPAPGGPFDAGGPLGA